MDKIETCWDKPFIRVSKKRFENFIRFFKTKNKIEGNYFMGWGDYYDWSLNPEFDVETASENEYWDNLQKCIVARSYLETPHPEYYLSVDYIKDNNYDLDTVVPKERKKRLTKKEKMLAEAFADAFDNFIRRENMNNELIVSALKSHVRVNVTLKTVEIYNEYGVQLVLRDLDEDTYNAFKETYQNF